MVMSRLAATVVGPFGPFHNISYDPAAFPADKPSMTKKNRVLDFIFMGLFLPLHRYGSLKCWVLSHKKAPGRIPRSLRDVSKDSGAILP